MNRTMQLAIYRMLYETCGEDQDLLNNAKITPIDNSDCKFHIQYKENDPMDGLDLKVMIKFYRDLVDDRYRDIAIYTIVDSVYADDGSFELVL